MEIKSVEYEKNISENAIVFDPNSNINLQNIDTVVDNITDMIEFMSSDDMIELQKNSVQEFNTILETKFAPFAESNPSVFKLLIKNDVNDISKLFIIIEQIYDIKNGKINFDDAFDNFKEKLANEYIYPKFGGKEKLEKKMKKKLRKKH